MNKLKIVFLLLSSVLAVLLITLFHKESRQPSLSDLPQDTTEVYIWSKPAVELSESLVDEELFVVREEVLQLVGSVEEGVIQARRQALEVLPQDLNRAELDLIYNQILERSWSDRSGLRAWHAFFNDVLNELVLSQAIPVDNLPLQLMDIISDDARHKVIRDYALQHLLSFAEYRMDGSERLAVLESAWQALSETRYSYRGTYLVALSYTAGKPDWPSVDEVSSMAWEVVNGEDTHVLSSITALQVCGKLGCRKVLPVALELAADERAHMTLRTSAIASIGDLGSEAESQFLTELFDRSPRRLQVAINAAIERISEKENPV